MTILVDNLLTGEPGLQVTNARLAASAEAGTVTVLTAGSRAVYDDTHTIHTHPAIRIASGHHRQETPRLRVTLPPAPWAVRWYVWHPTLQPAGYGTDEVRWLADLGGTGVVTVETAAGYVAARLQPQDLAAEWVSPTVGGTNRSLGRWVRMELRRTGSSLDVRMFEGHDTDPVRTGTWASPPNVTVLDLTGYRWRRRATLYWGDQGTAVRDLQLELIDLGYSLGPAGADGDFGNATHTAIQSFQSSRGLTPVDGVPGPETRAAMDMALGQAPPPLWLSHLAVADGEWIGPAELPPEPVQRRRLHVGYLPI